jgi:hypothetical protein
MNDYRFTFLLFYLRLIIPEQRARLVGLMFKKVVILNRKFDFTPNEVFAPLYGTRFLKRGEWLLGQDSNLQPSG